MLCRSALGIDLLSPRRTTIGAGVLDFRVRYGNGYTHSAHDTERTAVEQKRKRSVLATKEGGTH